MAQPIAKGAMAMIKSRLMANYKGLSREQLLQKAYDLGRDFERMSESCSQSTVATIHELVEMEDVVVRVATSSCGGQCGQVIGACGGMIGGTIALDYFFGRPLEQMSYTERKTRNLARYWEAMAVGKELLDRYFKEYGSIICPNIQTKLLGRTFYFPDPNDFEAFDKIGGHYDEDKCPGVVGKASRWVMEILLDKGAVEI
jgi:C_GCAxxG_C_C family probable redox protein